MENLLGNIYCWFETFFGQNLGDYLWGFDGNEYTLSNGFNTVGFTTLIISLLIVLLYYYGINHPRFNRWWSWLIMVFINAIIALFYGYYVIVSDLQDGVIADNLIYNRNEDGEIISALITSTDCWGFGVANVFVSIIFFIILSFLLKWKSRNCWHSPF